ncbi:MAG: adenylosuccinate synthase [Chthonomonas sp.]|nr:adenylosuccinate synthase [Chthonomonas sp.]
MSTLVIVGAQWGDEAKGKMVDVLAQDAKHVIRYSGGNNAGHTVIVGDKTFKFQLLPAGILHRDSTAILGGGMVIDPKGLLDELDRTIAIQPEIGKLMISRAAHVVFPYHRLLDELEEEARGNNKIGTTSRGIGPAYQDKVSRIGIRMCEFVCERRFRERLSEVIAVKNRYLALFGKAELDFDAVFTEYEAYANRLRPYVCDTDWLVQEAVYRGDKVLFEGAQGTFLDLDHGTYPYVTSSHPVAAGACLGTGIGPRAIENVLGVCKAYTTRVGSGPFPTELLDDIGEQIRQQGQEFGTVTGRSRRTGWLDLVALRQSARLNSLSGWVVTRLDVLRDIPELKLAIGYELDGQPIEYLPADIEDFARVTPVFRTIPGWTEDLCPMRSYDELPATVKEYMRVIEEFTGTPVAIASIGPDRAETIIIKPELIWG